MKVAKSVGLLLLLFGGSYVAQADDIKFYFSGTIDFNGYYNGSGIAIPGIRPGDNYSGFFSYDPSVVTFSSTASTPCCDKNVSYLADSFVAKINGLLFDVANPEINIDNEFDFQDFNVFGEVRPGLYMNFNLLGNRSFPTLILPSDLTLANWCCAADFVLSDLARPTEFPFGAPGESFQVSGDLASLKQVPEPPSILMSLFGIIPIWFLVSGRGRKQILTGFQRNFDG